MPRLSNIGVLVCGIALCITGVLAILYRPKEEPRTVPPQPEQVARELTVADLPLHPDVIKKAGEKLIADKKCNFCHRQDPSVTPEHPRADCEFCHQRQNPQVHYHLAPPLNSIAARRPGAWLRRYLRYPYAIRVHSPSRMPDMALTDFENEVAARYIEQLASTDLLALNTSGPAREAKPDAAKLEQARVLVNKYTCGMCHSIGASEAMWLSDPAILASNPGAIFAPDLGRTWNRVRPGWLKGAILKPSHAMAWSGMPDNSAMTEAEAELLAWFVMNCVPDLEPMKIKEGDLEVTLGYPQIQEIFNTRCLSCHYSPRPDPPMTANPEGGSGWLATWGKTRHLSFESFEHAIAGSLDDLGRRRPVVVPYAENSPILVHLRGLKQPQMPFGRDPLSESEYKLIENWVLTGARGPHKQEGVTIYPPLEFEGK
jgi:cytochrome c5